MPTLVKRGPYQYQATVRRRGFKTQCKTFETRAQALAWAHAVEASMHSGQFRDPSAFWRPSRVKQLLDNTIYRGVFTWHGSTTHAAECKARGVEPDIHEYARPHLRLVSDELW